MREMIRQMKGGVLQSDRMEQLLTLLAERLQTVSGKKQYGYLKPDLKKISWTKLWMSWHRTACLGSLPSVVGSQGPNRIHLHRNPI